MARATCFRWSFWCPLVFRYFRTLALTISSASRYVMVFLGSRGVPPLFFTYSGNAEA